MEPYNVSVFGFEAVRILQELRNYSWRNRIRLQIVSLELIASGANVNQIDEPLNFTPLMAAFSARAGEGSPEIVERLLRAGAKGEDLPERFMDASRGKALECIAVVRRWTEPDLRARLTRAE